MVNFAKNTEHARIVNEFVNFIMLEHFQHLGDGMEIIESLKSDDDSTGSSDSIFDPEGHHSALLSMSSKLCSYIYWAYKQAKIPMKADFEERWS